MSYFHSLTISRVTPEAAGAVVLSFAIPPELQDLYRFNPGQFLTLRATINTESVRRSYSICSSTQLLAARGEIEVGIKPVEGGAFSNWATHLQAGDTLDVMPPEGRFTPRITGAVHRVGWAAGSGITPLLSIIASTLAGETDSTFTLVYCNQRSSSILFNEALQDLKDRYPARLNLIHLLSRQAQEVALFNGRLDVAKASQLLASLIPPAGIAETFICGPEAMIEACEQALRAAGVPRERIHSERFTSSVQPADAINSLAVHARQQRAEGQNGLQSGSVAGPIRLSVQLDGKSYELRMHDHERVLDVALAAGLDLPYSCKGGVCCTCRAKVIAGQVHMEKNFTLEDWEVKKGFVLSCQARPLSDSVSISYDDR
ncbi:2Fe-2S iron-sulfur cluster-binding protein [Polaromonas eurypsychrophila]|uniref:Phenylacetic acid degradation NADH oxidoreductase PaaE n=1 Tax=Polaromonas eurypsychrophila TaxID=1614635 RepID=A0A916WF65_9BURK|nr:2Fe-2S iron-sulfur cluster-binding protein [Polaromonas eurypsychrophila]GGA93555.1 phenylacetic acid degradation NADH oxidoreductase PaaE [Polaromonas eurypsychrophila]